MVLHENIIEFMTAPGRWPVAEVKSDDVDSTEIIIRAKILQSMPADFYSFMLTKGYAQKSFTILSPVDCIMTFRKLDSEIDLDCLENGRLVVRAKNYFFKRP